MAGISLQSNILSQNTQRWLSRATATLSVASQRLSSGLRINRASDDAAGLSVASLLSADSRVFSQGIRNANDAVSFLQIADGATESLGSIVTRIAELAEQSANGVLSNAQRAPLDEEAQALVQEYNRIVATTEFNGRRLFEDTGFVDIQIGYSTLAVSPGSLTSSVVGDGTFSALVSTTSAGNAAPSAGDLNGDGVADLIAFSGGSTWRTFIGNGDGTFSVTTNTAAGTLSGTTQLADFNNDGVLDAALTSDGSNKLYVAIGNGDGSFRASVSFAGAQDPEVVRIADVNADGRNDVVSGYNSSSGNYVVLIGNGDGTFLAQQTFAGGGSALDIGDLNGDGKIDVVGIELGAGLPIKVSLGNGNGTFQAPITYAGNTETALNLSLGDFNGDGNLDYAHDTFSSGVIIGLGNGDGSFQAPTVVGSVSSAYGIAINDVNEDGLDDIISANSTSLTYLISQGDGTFTQGASFAAASTSELAVVDIDGDGTQDVVTASGGRLNISLANSTASASITPLRVNTQANALTTLDRTAEVRTAISSARQVIGADLSRLSSALSNLQSSTENYTEAASRIMDADVAETSAQYTASQIQQQVVASILAQANQQPAMALRLLR